MTKTITKTTPELTIGDVVFVHGCRLQLTGLYYDGREHGAREQNTRGFNTKYLGPVDAGFDPVEVHGGYGSEMVNNQWAIQGNELARWSVDADPSWPAAQG